MAAPPRGAPLDGRAAQLLRDRLPGGRRRAIRRPRNPAARNSLTPPPPPPPFQESDGGAGAFDDDDTNKIFIDFLSQGYKLFLEGDDDDAERVVQLHEQIQFVFDEKAGTLEKASAEIQEGNAKMQRQLGADTDGGRPLEREQKRKAVLDEDERKFNELLTKLVNYVTELRKKAAAAAGTLAELTTEVAALDEENASLKHVISLQEMTPADVERMGKEKAELTATLASLREQKEAKQKEVWEGKDALGQAAQRLETKTQKANAAAARLDLLDADGALSGAIDHELRLHAAGGASGGATVEIGGGVLPALQSLKLDLADEHKRKHDEYLAAEDGAAAAETSRMGREKLLAQQKAELAQLDADGARKKEEREGALAEKRAERAALGVSAEDKKARAKSELDQVRAEKAAKQEEYDAFVARVQRDEQVTGRHCHHRLLLHHSPLTTLHSPAPLPPPIPGAVRRARRPRRLPDRAQGAAVDAAARARAALREPAAAHQRHDPAALRARRARGALRGRGAGGWARGRGRARAIRERAREKTCAGAVRETRRRKVFHFIGPPPARTSRHGAALLVGEQGVVAVAVAVEGRLGAAPPHS